MLHLPDREFSWSPQVQGVGQASHPEDYVDEAVLNGECSHLLACPTTCILRQPDYHPTK
jgi:hypothetical protein